MVKLTAIITLPPVLPTTYGRDTVNRHRVIKRHGMGEHHGLLQIYSMLMCRLPLKHNTAEHHKLIQQGGYQPLQ